MGVMIYPVIQDPTADWTRFRTASKPLAKVVLDLEKAAKREGVQSLYDFFSMSNKSCYTGRRLAGLFV